MKDGFQQTLGTPQQQSILTTYRDSIHQQIGLNKQINLKSARFGAQQSPKRFPNSYADHNKSIVDQLTIDPYVYVHQKKEKKRQKSREQVIRMLQERKLSSSYNTTLRKQQLISSFTDKIDQTKDISFGKGHQANQSWKSIIQNKDQRQKNYQLSPQAQKLQMRHKKRMTLDLLHNETWQPIYSDNQGMTYSEQRQRLKKQQKQRGYRQLMNAIQNAKIKKVCKIKSPKITQGQQNQNKVEDQRKFLKDIQMQNIKWQQNLQAKKKQQRLLANFLRQQMRQRINQRNHNTLKFFDNNTFQKLTRKDRSFNSGFSSSSSSSISKRSSVKLCLDNQMTKSVVDLDLQSPRE